MLDFTDYNITSESLQPNLSATNQNSSHTLPHYRVHFSCQSVSDDREQAGQVCLEMLISEGAETLKYFSAYGCPGEDIPLLGFRIERSIVL